MEKFKAYGCIMLFGMSCFIYGGYLYGTLNCNVVVKPHQWFLTGLFGLFFLFLGIDKIKNL